LDAIFASGNAEVGDGGEIATGGGEDVTTIGLGVDGGILRIKSFNDNLSLLRIEEGNLDGFFTVRFCDFRHSHQEKNLTLVADHAAVKNTDDLKIRAGGLYIAGADQRVLGVATDIGS
jgi:hypothetical protein